MLNTDGFADCNDQNDWAGAGRVMSTAQIVQHHPLCAAKTQKQTYLTKKSNTLQIQLYKDFKLITLWLSSSLPSGQYQSSSPGMMGTSFVLS